MTVPDFLSRWQHNLNEWASEFPADAVLGCAKSVFGSCIITAVYTQGNGVAMVKSIAAAAAASTTHTAMMTIFKKYKKYTSPSPPRTDLVQAPPRLTSYASHTVALGGLVVPYLLFGNKLNINAWWTWPVTGLLYILTRSPKTATDSTPLYINFASI
jgi:hypothetical protein